MAGETEGWQVEDVRWLASEPGLRWLNACAQESVSGSSVSSGFLKRLRGEVGAERARLVLLQQELRLRAVAKFGRATDMLFWRQGLEQATDEAIAFYKARRFHDLDLSADLPTADVCCGIGGDTLGLSQGRSVTAFDLQPVATVVAEHNARVYGGTARGVAGEAEAFDWDTFPGTAAHVDPDRRAGGRRVSRYAHLVPGPEFLEQLAEACPHLALKLAPATDELPQKWAQDGEREWIESRGECRQQVLWLGQLAQAPGRRVATRLTQKGESFRLVGPTEEEDDEFPDAIADRVGRYVYEPRPAVLAARLGIHLARQLGLDALTVRGGYLTGDDRHDHPLLQAFQVQEVLPLRVKKWKALLLARNVGRLEIKQRGASLDPEQLRRQLRLRGEQAATLIVMQRGPQTVGILADRLE